MLCYIKYIDFFTFKEQQKDGFDCVQKPKDVSNNVLMVHIFCPIQIILDYICNEIGLYDYYSSQGKEIISRNKKSTLTATVDEQIDQSSGTEVITKHLDYDVQSITTGSVSKIQCEAQTNVIQNMRMEELIDLVKSNGEHLKLSKYPPTLQGNTVLEERATYYLGIVEEKDGKKVLIPVLNKNSEEYISFMKSRKTRKYKSAKKCKQPEVDKKSRCLKSKPNSDCPVKKKGGSSKKSIGSSKKIKSADVSHAKLVTLPPLTKRRSLDLV